MRRSRHATTQGAAREGPRTRADAAGPAESDWAARQALPFASRRFHVLFNSLFKVLFNFPSRYLFAIGLATVFSLRWSLPPALGCIPKQPDSEKTLGARTPAAAKGLTPALGRGLDHKDVGGRRRTPCEFYTPQLGPLQKRPDSAMGSSRFTRRYWGNPR